MNTKTLQLATGVFEGCYFPTTLFLYSIIFGIEKGKWREEREGIMSKKKTQEEFEQEVFKKLNNEYIVTGTYINNRTKIELEVN